KRQLILKLQTERLDAIEKRSKDNTLSFTAQRLTHLSRLRQEYAYALTLFDQFPAGPPLEGRDYQLEARLDKASIGPYAFLGPLRDSREQARAEQIAEFYSRVVKDTFYHKRHEMLRKLLASLKKRADDLYEAGKRDVIEARPQAAAAEFIRRGLTNQIW